MNDVRRADFQKIKDAVGIEAVLEALGVLDTLEQKKADELGGVCPLPSHTGEKSKVQFYANTVKDTFFCHGCKAKGNVLELVAQHGLPNGEGKVSLREAGLWIEDTIMNGGEVRHDTPQSSVATGNGELEEIKERLATAFVDLVQYLLVRMPK